MADSPHRQSDGRLDFSVSVNGKAISDSHDVRSIRIQSRANRIPRAHVVICDGSVASLEFFASDGDTFIPGAEIKIESGYEDQKSTIFGGIIIKHGMRIRQDGGSSLELECTSKAIGMTIGRKNAVYTEKSDSDILSTLIADAGMKDDIEKTDVKFGELVQYYCTDWDFLISRAEVNGFITCINDETVEMKTPKTSGSPVLTITYGTDVIECDAAVDCTTQPRKVTSVGWDIKKQAVVEVEGKDAGWDDQGTLMREELAKICAPESYRLQTTSPLTQESLQRWADAKITKANLSKIIGTVKFPGSSKVSPGKVIELDGVGDKFNGNVLVTGVIHEIEAGTWTTECEFGLSDEWFAAKTDIVAPPASGFLPGIQGLHIGTVMKLEGDPEKMSRIQIKLPVLGNDEAGVWARMGHMYATKTGGAFFLPEIGDEVIVGFFNNDPSQPVILGTMYNGVNVPSHEITKDNYTKAFMSKERLMITFDDEKKILTIETPGANRFVLNDDEKNITISDQNDNTIVLSESGISIESKKDITLKAGGNIDLNAKGALNLKSTGDVTVKGKNVKANAQIGLTAKGSATAEISASGTTTVKGAMVKIN